MLVPTKPIVENHAASKKYVDESVNELTYRVGQLESSSLKYTEYSSVTDAVPVPENAARYAIVEKIGGMSYKSNSVVPPFRETETLNGITITRNGDDSFTLNGTAYYNASIPIGSISSLREAKRLTGNYTVSIDKALPSGVNIIFDNTGGYHVILEGGQTSNTFNFNKIYNYDYFIQRIYIPSGTSFTGETYYLMVNPGETVLPYTPYFEGLRDTDVTELVSEAVNGKLVDDIDIPEAVKNKLPEHFKFGDGIDKDVCNYLNLETETVHGLVARMELNGDEPGWKASTNAGSGVTRLQFNYDVLGVPLAWLKINESGKQDTSAVTPAKCNRYESISPSNTVRGIKGIAFSPTTFFVHDPYFTLAVFKSEADIVEAWKAHLKSNPLTVVYKVANPVTENVSDIVGDMFNRLVVSPLGKIKPISEYNTAAPITVSFVEAKGVNV